MRKYNLNFERDFSWYLSMRHTFNFAGRAEPYMDKKGNHIVIYDKQGYDAKECFFQFDSSGKILKTKHPNLLTSLYRTKASINLQAKEYAIDRYSGLLSKVEFEQICIDIKAPRWFIDTVENQKIGYYIKHGPYKLI